MRGETRRHQQPLHVLGAMVVAPVRLDRKVLLRRRDGQPLWYKKPSPKRPNGEPLTLKLAADTYTVVIQFGAIAAVALLYWPQFMSMLRGLLGRDSAGFRLFFNVMIAFLPAAGIGFVAHDWIDAHLFSVGAVICAQVAGALLMFYAEAWRKRRAAGPEATHSAFRPTPQAGPYARHPHTCEDCGRALELIEDMRAGSWSTFVPIARPRA